MFDNIWLEGLLFGVAFVVLFNAPIVLSSRKVRNSKLIFVLSVLVAGSFLFDLVLCREFAIYELLAVSMLCLLWLDAVVFQS